MPKIQHIARFTAPARFPIQQSTNVDSGESTPVKRHVLPQKLVELNEQRQATRTTLLDYIVLCLTESKQPLSVIETAELVSRELNKRYDPNTIRLFLQELETEGKVSSRVETSEERSIRASNGKARALHATLWWAPAGEVPARTITEAVPGVRLNDSAGRSPGRPRKVQEDVQLVETTQETVDTIGNPVVDYLVNKLVDERTKELREEVERLRLIVKNLVKDL
jgi:hypothetical protein